jgi:ATP-dependent Clp protease adaptor protein ClpS
MPTEVAPAVPATSSTRTKRKSKPLPPYHVVLLDDDDHSVEYVMVMLQELFAIPQEAGYELAMETDRHGRAVVLTTHKERAELKREQIHAYGPDHAVATCRGSMSACIEPAEA